MDFFLCSHSAFRRKDTDVFIIRVVLYSRKIPIIFRFDSDKTIQNGGLKVNYNHGLAEKKYKEEWQKKENQYRELGMTDEQIEALHEFDEREFKSDRAYYEKKVTLSETEEYNGEFIDETNSEYLEEHWTEYIADSEKYQQLMNVPKDMRKAFYLSKVMGISQQEISSFLLIPQQTISYWIVKISKILK